MGKNSILGFGISNKKTILPKFGTHVKCNVNLSSNSDIKKVITNNKFKSMYKNKKQLYKNNKQLYKNKNQLNKNNILKYELDKSFSSFVTSNNDFNEVIMLLKKVNINLQHKKLSVYHRKNTLLKYTDLYNRFDKLLKKYLKLKYKLENLENLGIYKYNYKIVYCEYMNIYNTINLEKDKKIYNLKIKLNDCKNNFRLIYNDLNILLNKLNNI